MKRLGALAAVALLLASCHSGGKEPPSSLPGAKLIHFTVARDLVSKRLEQAAIDLPPPKQVAHDLEQHGADVTVHEFPGGHSGGYTRDHLGEYVAFSAKALKSC